MRVSAYVKPKKKKNDIILDLCIFYQMNDFVGLIFIIPKDNIYMYLFI